MTLAASRINWRELFFSPAGRVGSFGFLIAIGCLWVALGLFDALAQGDLRVFGWVGYPVLISILSCVLSKRLHDRGRSGWWSALVILAVIMVWPAPKHFLDFLGVIVLVWAGVELGFMPGERGTNRYGPNPARPETRSQNP